MTDTETDLDVLLHIASPDAARIAAPLGRAFVAMGVRWGCFLTNDGVRTLDDAAFAAVAPKAERLVVCEHSRDRHLSSPECIAECGSQTVNSALMAAARRVVSL